MPPPPKKKKEKKKGTDTQDRHRDDSHSHSREGEKAVCGGSTNGEGAEVGNGPSRHKDVASDPSHHPLQLLHRLSPPFLLVRQPVDQLATEENNSARTVQLGAQRPFHALSFALHGRYQLVTEREAL